MVLTWDLGFSRTKRAGHDDDEIDVGGAKVRLCASGSADPKARKPKAPLDSEQRKRSCANVLKGQQEAISAKASEAAKELGLNDPAQIAQLRASMAAAAGST